MLLWIVLGTLLVLTLVALLHSDPQTVRQLVASICLAVQTPFSVVQNILAAAATGLRGSAGRIFDGIGSLRKSIGAFIHLAVFCILAFFGLFLTLLTIGAMFGVHLSWSPPASLEVLSAIGLIIASAFLVAVTMEAFGLPHFGHWEAMPSRLKPLLLGLLLVLIALGIVLIVWMGIARSYSLSVNTEQLQTAVETSETDPNTNALDEAIRSLDTSPEEVEITRKVMIGLPLFIDSVAALAFSGAILGLQVLGACLLWLLSVIVQVVNIPFTIAVQVIDHIGNALIAVFDFLHTLGGRLGWQEEPSLDRQLPSNGQQSPQQQGSFQIQQPSGQQSPSSIGQPSQQPLQTGSPLPLANHGGNGGAPAAPPVGNEEDFPEPELTPIGPTFLNPLGMEGQQNDASGGAQR